MKMKQMLMLGIGHIACTENKLDANKNWKECEPGEREKKNEKKGQQEPGKILSI